MIKHKILSSLELLNLSKPRVKLMLKDLIDNLLILLNNSYCENLNDLKNLYTYLKNKGINDISSYISENIVDYKIQINTSFKQTVSNIELIFKSGFPANKINIKNLEL